MIKFLLGMATMYFLFNLMVVIYIVITEGREILELKKNKFKVILVLLSMFFVGVPFVVINRDNF